MDDSNSSCSICLDLVADCKERSVAKLQCGHDFHLDCIGSAFNMKGAMQCPNCRKIEDGRWLYANGSSRSLPDFGIDDWSFSEEPYEYTFPEMPFGVHWCPFSGLTGVHSSFELSFFLWVCSNLYAAVFSPVYVDDTYISFVSPVYVDDTCISFV